MHPKDAAGIANSVDPDQTAPLGLLWYIHVSNRFRWNGEHVDPDQTAPSG